MRDPASEVLTSLIYEVVYCTDCKKPIKSVPSWMASVNVRFTCESCRQKHPRGVVGFDSSVAPRIAGADDVEAESLIDDAPGELVEEELDDVADEALVGGVVEE